MSARGSSKTAVESARSTRCFLELPRALAGSHWNVTGQVYAQLCTGATRAVRTHATDRMSSCAGYQRHSMASRRPPIVVVEATEHGERNEPPVGTGAVRRGRSRNALIEPLVRTRSIEERHVLGEDGAKVALAEDDQVIATLASDTAEETLAGRVHDGRRTQVVGRNRRDVFGSPTSFTRSSAESSSSLLINATGAKTASTTCERTGS